MRLKACSRGVLLALAAVLVALTACMFRVPIIEHLFTSGAPGDLP